MVAWHGGQERDGWPGRAIGGVRVAAEGSAILEGDAVVHCRFDALIWKDPTVRPAPLGSAVELAPGLVALRGPGRLSPARSSLGETLPLCLAPGGSMLLRSDAIVLATTGLQRATAVQDLPPRAEPDLEAFEATEEALVLLQAAGSIFEAALGADDSVDVAHGALLYADVSVSLEAVEQRLSDELTLAMVRCAGPGRIGMQTVIAGA
jgi:hypothetical protein